MKQSKTVLIKYQSDIIIVLMNLLIRDIPLETHQNLRERAKMNRRSLNQEIVSLLVAVSSQETEEDRIRKRREELLQVTERIDKIRKMMPAFASPEEIDQAKHEGRA